MVEDWGASFGLGFATGAGGCLLFCGPVLVSYLVATRNSLKDKIISTLFFSFWKTVPYLIFGYLAGEIGQNVITNLNNPVLNHWLKTGTGVFLIFLSGLIVARGKFSRHRFCKVWERYLARRQEPGIITLGLLFGLMPCAPLLSLLTYIAFMVKDPWLGMVCTLFFSLGTTIPLLLAGTAAGAGSLFFKSAKTEAFLRWAGGGIIFIWGIRMFLW